MTWIWIALAVFQVHIIWYLCFCGKFLYSGYWKCINYISEYVQFILFNSCQDPLFTQPFHCYLCIENKETYLFWSWNFLLPVLGVPIFHLDQCSQKCFMSIHIFQTCLKMLRILMKLQSFQSQKHQHEFQSFQLIVLLFSSCRFSNTNGPWN